MENKTSTDVTISSPDGAVSNDAAGQSSSPVAETSEQLAGGVSASESETTAQTEPDIFEGIPSPEELQQQAEQRVPYSEGLLRLRTELERVKPELAKYEPYKSVFENHDPVRIEERLQAHDSLFSPKVVDGQPVLDDRGLPLTTAHPFLASHEEKQPGYAMSHFLDVLDFPVTNPTTGQAETLVSQFFREVLGLDVGKLEQYQQIDTLIAKPNGSITPEELARVAEPDHDAYKALKPIIRKDWEYLDEDTRREYLDEAKERLETRRFVETTKAEKQAKQEADRQKFEHDVQTTFVQDLAQVREGAFSSLRDNLARVWQPSTDEAINQDRYDDVLAPLTQLIDPDLQPMALKRLEREGIKVNVPEFNANMSALVGARQTYVRATAYGEQLAAERAEQDFNRLQTQMMAKFNTIALQRAEKYGMQAKQIADQKGELLTRASQVRPTVPGSTAPQTFNASGLPAGMDPRSQEAALLTYRQSIGQA